MDVRCGSEVLICSLHFCVVLLPEIRSSLSPLSDNELATSHTRCNQAETISTRQIFLLISTPQFLLLLLVFVTSTCLLLPKNSFPSTFSRAMLDCSYSFFLPHQTFPDYCSSQSVHGQASCLCKSSRK